MNRRIFIQAGLMAGLAGCSALEDAEESSSPEEEEDAEGPSEEEDAEEEDTGDDRTLEAFDELDDWDVHAGSLSADPSMTNGSQSARIEIEDEGRGVIARQFSEPIDLSDTHLGVAFESTGSLSPRVRLVDEGGDRVDLRMHLREEIPLQPYDVGVESTNGSPDLSSVAEIRIIVQHDGPGTIWCDELLTLPRPETPKLLFQFDDGAVTDYTQGYRVLERFDYPATSFVNPNTIDTSGRLSTDQLSELHEEGWCISSHLMDHDDLREMDADEQAEQIGGAKEWLVDHGFERGAEYFTYTYGSYDASALELVREHHTLAFAGGFPGYGHPINRVLVPRQGDPSPERATELIDATVEWNGITGLFFHTLSDSGEVTVSEFEEIVEYVREREENGELEVITPVELERFVV
jgi:peptidoglycan/xylan/chitin deacetylase (PgdA/CDA1 family)